MIRYCLLYCTILFSIKIIAQDSFILKNNQPDTALKTRFYQEKSFSHFNKYALIVPGILIGYGVTSLSSQELQKINIDTRNEIREHNPTFSTGLDNFLQYSPAFAVYALNIAGIHGQNNFRDRTMIYCLSNLYMATTVLTVKHLTKELRPDGSDYYSFPSGHTATAFAAAEFLRQEYKNVSPWYGIAGYTAATATGILRMYNNKHWLSDVAAGAGVGILSTKLAYWSYPFIKRKLFNNKPVTTMVVPFYQNNAAGISLVHHF